MNESDKDFYCENGYVGPFSVHDTRKIKALLRSANWEISKIKILRKLKLSTKRIKFERNGHLSSNQIFEIASDGNILDNVSVLLGPNILLWVAHLINRPPKNNGQAWHYDEINKFVGGIHASVAITDMNVNNGCLHVIPKTHNYRDNLRELNQHGECDLNDFESVLKLADRLHPENAPHCIVPIELKAGQYFLNQGGLWHAVNRNKTSGSRKAVVARYMRPEVKGVDIYNGQPLPCILVRGEDDFKLNPLHEIPKINIFFQVYEDEKI